MSSQIISTEICESMVISIEYAKELKRLGVPQDSALYWHESKIGYRTISSKRFILPLESYSAFTSEEVCRLLFNYTTKVHQILDKKNIYVIKVPALKTIVFEDTRQQDACVKMLIHLVERRMIKL